MTQAINLGVTALPVGEHQFVVSVLPDDSTGFRFVLGRDASWPAGHLFSVVVEIALDGTVFQPWCQFSVDGGPAKNRMGDPATSWALLTLWPGETAGDQRKVLRATDVRVTLTVAQAFTAQSVSLNAT